MKAVHFGAGNIGRGFIGNVLHDNGFEITFVDTNDQIIQQINEDKGYVVELLNEEQTRIVIDQVQALHSIREEEQVIESLVEADLITTSVGAQNLTYLAPVLKKALLLRAEKEGSINLLANENVIGASDLLKKEIHSICSKEEWERILSITYFVNTAIDRQALLKEDNGKQIAVVEPYFEWVIDANAIDPQTAFELKKVKLVTDMTPFIERKLFIVNAEHAAFAYLGALLGYMTVQETIRDESCKQLVLKFMQENEAYFLSEYDMKDDELETFIQNTLKRHGNPVISDDVHRVGRSPLRKLNRQDRLIAPVMKLEELGLKNQAGKKIIAAGYLYANQEDEEAVRLQQLIKKVGFKQAIQEISDISENIAQEISEIAEKAKVDKKTIFTED